MGLRTYDPACGDAFTFENFLEAATWGEARQYGKPGLRANSVGVASAVCWQVAS